MLPFFIQKPPPYYSVYLHLCEVDYLHFESLAGRISVDEFGTKAVETLKEIYQLALSNYGAQLYHPLTREKRGLPVLPAISPPPPGQTCTQLHVMLPALLTFESRGDVPTIVYSTLVWYGEVQGLLDRGYAIRYTSPCDKGPNPRLYTAQQAMRRLKIT